MPKKNTTKTRVKRTKKAVADSDRPKRSDRDKAGRFAKGNPGGPGNPSFKKLAEYRRTISEAVTPDDIRRVMATLIRKAEDGDLMAAKEILDRSVGRASSGSAMAKKLDVSLPEMAKPRDAVEASNAILAAVADGRIAPEDASRLIPVVELARRTIETHDLAEQLDALRDRIEEGL